MIDNYVNFVLANPLLSAVIQFAILGTLGELLAFSFMKKKFALPCTFWQLIAKILAWALLGIFVKYSFVGIKGFSYALLEHNLLPQMFATGIGSAFAVSVLLNLFCGPQTMFLHRLSDNIIIGKKDYKGLTTAWWTLIWFWIPAHTITFSLPIVYQIGLAALWGMVLGIILGLNKK